MDLDSSPYRLPLRRPWTSARGGFPLRCGWLVTASDEGLCGYGDCAPLPAAGTESALTARRRLRQAAAAPVPASPPGPPSPNAAPGSPSPSSALGPPSPSSARERSERTPAADYALDCALADLASRRAHQPLRHLLAPGARDRVPVNAVLGAIIDTRPADLDRAVRQGFRVIKLKAGLATPEQELARLRDLAATLPPGIALRLDANGAWDPETAAALIRVLATLPIESLEEPLCRADWPNLARLQALAPFPLALDESVADAAALDPAGLPVRRIVLKPAVVGGLSRTLDTARRLAAGGIEVVLTSLVESAAGLWPTAQLAAALGSSIPQGLATADWLGADLGAPPPIRNGWLHLPATPGSGFAPWPGWPGDAGAAASSAG